MTKQACTTQLRVRDYGSRVAARVTIENCPGARPGAGGGARRRGRGYSATRVQRASIAGARAENL